MHPRSFTVAEANALLPELEQVLARIRSAGEALRRHVDQVQILDAIWGDRLTDPATPDHEEFREHRSEIQRLAEMVDTMIAVEITGRGIRFPQGGLEHGLLDFPTTLEGRWVYLCWQAGEPTVLAWHETDDGFAGRQPLTPELARSMGT